MTRQEQKISQIIDRAKLLGIALTNARLGSEMFFAWCERVELAAAQFDRGDMVACQESINSANQYAI